VPGPTPAITASALEAMLRLRRGLNDRSVCMLRDWLEIGCLGVTFTVA
jgi:hypothetical protein